jgi:uncharacterized Fe-S cluster-containing radical SAM superfamily protein
MTIEYLYKTPKTLLNKGTGFLSGYSHSLNPYTGCAFACSYCYVRQMPVSTFRNSEWGTWIDIKKDAASTFQKELLRAKAKGPVTIFMSSSTDPYQPIEHKEKITQSLLEIMVDNPPDFLLVQTRSPLVRRDIKMLQQLGTKVRVSMTVETDREDIRKHFAPYAPPIPARLKTLQLLAEFGIPTQGLPSHPYYRVASDMQKYCVPWLTEYVLTIILWVTEAVVNEHTRWAYKCYIEIWKWKNGIIHPSIKWFINECGSIFRKMNFSLARRVSNHSVIIVIFKSSFWN